MPFVGWFCVWANSVVFKVKSFNLTWLVSSFNYKIYTKSASSG